MSDVDENRLKRARGQKLSSNGPKELLLSLKIKSYLANSYNSNYRKHEPYILADKSYIAAIENGRKSLGFSLQRDISLEIDEDDLEKWVVYLTTGEKNLRPSSALYKSAVISFSKTVRKVLSEANLPNKWDYYVAFYLLTGYPPQDNAFDFDLVEVQSVDKDGVSLKFRKGISKAQYDKVWQVVADVLGEPNKTQIVSKDTKRNLEILSKKDSGLTYAELAKEYFPAQAESDIAAAEDTIKKIVRREREKFKSGTKLEA